MADTDNVETSETVAAEPLKNDAIQPAPVAPAAPSKEENQTIMRLAQEKKELEAKLAAKDKAEADAAAKKLEENQEYKTLLEQERAAKDELLAERDAREKKETVDKTASEVLKDYTDEVKDLAKDLGVSLSDDSEEAVADFKAKLDSAAKRVGITKVTPNNPAAPASTGKASGDELRKILADPVQRDAYMREHYPTTAAMMTPRSTT